MPGDDNSTLAGFVLWNAKQHPIPIQPVRTEVSDFTSTQPKSASGQAHKPCLQVTGLPAVNYTLPVGAQTPGP